MQPIPAITLEKLLSQYEVLLFDAYGVLVHSAGALPGAAALITELNRRAKPYYMLTNDASKLPTTAAARYQSYGLPLSSEHIISSGELLTPYFATHQLQGARCAVLGPVDSIRYVEQAGGQVVPPGEPFEVLVVGDESGFPFLETVDTMLSTLCRLLDQQRTVHLVLPNPDIIYPSDIGFGMASGCVAMMFEAALQARYPERKDLRFVRLGKPYTAIFAEAVRRSGTHNMVMFGDQLATDIRGARTFGLDAVLVNTGVTTEIAPTTPVELRPTYQLGSLEALLKEPPPSGGR
ncbi:MAG: haloacid dehalogenase [Candidatus Tectomicrobia bacterium]|uniref:Haloacid dehalogenase n=1 Tax=Tectimicrobiota bacterium TaxID=2528274 RepID=A0A938B1F9_UNCTE|nr:haloacid dehalogenase [Candidatus Tectomicrobia bacterium]